MLATTLCRDSDPADSSVNGHFPSFRAVYSIHTVCEGARPDEARDILGHANIDVTQNVYGKKIAGKSEGMRSLELSKQ
jgi:hypothetical protein